MKKWWKNLSYRKKIILNLLVIAFWAFGLWARADYPLPTTEMEFRRMERTRLLPESEIVFLSEREDDVFTVAAGLEAGKELVIDGGCHAFFGCYGAQKGDGTPTLTAKEQIEQTADAVASLTVINELKP